MWGNSKVTNIEFIDGNTDLLDGLVRYRQAVKGLLLLHDMAIHIKTDYSNLT